MPLDSQASYSTLKPRTDEENNAYLGCAKALDFLLLQEKVGSVGPEKGSVYGAAVVIPQIARSAGWPGSMLALTIRCYCFLLINILLQGFLLSMIGEVQHFMNSFAGKMHLCDFGADLQNCPDGPNCRGPGGTAYTFSRLYGYDVWSTRSFIRDSLKAVFPHHKDEIDAAADPGEYGLENYYCRLVCCFIFMMGVLSDLRQSLNTLRLLYYIPTQNEPWVRYESPEWGDHRYCKSVHDWRELNLVKFVVAGMPLSWKLVNFLVVFLPKISIWLILVNSGFHFLMETAGIVDVIMNAMALTFILNLDEMVFVTLTTVAVQHMVDNTEDMPLFEESILEDEEEDQILLRYEQDELGRNKYKSFLNILVPKRLLTCIVLMPVFLFKYYWSNCIRGPDGSWFSQPMFVPADISFRPWNYIFSGIEVKEKVPFWTMPPSHK